MNNKTLIAVYGASGFGREIMPLLRYEHSSNINVDLVFIDDALNEDSINGHRVVTYNKFLSENHDNKYALVAIADSKIREDLTNKLLSDSIKILSVTAKNAIDLDNNSIDEGAILCPFTTITSNVTIGKSFHANIYSYVAHDCVIGDYVTFAPNVHCNGNVHIEDHVYIGTGAIIKQGTPSKPLVIGKGAVIGMGSVVTKSVKAGDVVFGIPAKSIKRG